MRIAVIGGGPGGLYFAALAKQLGPDHEISVWERNAADDTFGFGVVFSDETLGGIAHADPVIHDQMEQEFARWDDIDVHYRGEVVTSGGHGFAALGRKRLLEILQRRCADLGVDVQFSSTAPDVELLSGAYDLVVAADGVNSLVRTKYADRFQPTLDVRRCRYMWLGTDKVFEAFTFEILETPHGVMQMHGYPFDAHGSTFIVEMHDDVWRRAGFDGSRRTTSRRASPTRPRSPRSASSSPRARRTRGPGQQLPLGQLHHRPQRALVPRQRRAARRRRPHRALLHRVRHQAGHGGRALPGRLPARVGGPEGRARGVRAGAQGRGHLHPARGPGEPRMVREPGPVHPSAPSAVRLQHPHPQPPHHLRQPAAARPGVHRAGRRVVRHDPAGGRARDRGAVPADVRAVPARPARPGQPGRRLTHGHVRLTGRLAGRLPPGPPRRQGTRWCRPGDDRDGLRLSPCPHHTRLRRTVVRRAGRGLEADLRLRARLVAGTHRSPARPQRTQGLHEADVGGNGPTAAGGELAAGLGLGSALPGGRQPDSVVAGSRRHGRRGRRLRVGGPARGDGRLRPAGAPLRARLPAVRVPVAGDQPPHRRLRRRRPRPAAVPARGVRRGARGAGPPTGP